MHKIFLFCLGLLSLTVASAKESLRQMTVIVRPEMSNNVRSFGGAYSLWLARQGHRSASRDVRSYTNDNFGSGFCYNYNNHSLILTNRHVVGLAETVTIEIVSDNNDSTKYEHCRVIAKSDKTDIAAIELPQGATLPSFTFSTQNVTDGTKVYSTGYPGLGNKPSWQYGLGIVSNAKFFDESLTGDKTVPVLQHTANVDAGNSGGPLLIEDSKTSSGYAVVGINTWKARGRENTNFAISVVSIQEFLKTITDATYQPIGRAELVSAATQLTTSNESFLPSLISYDYFSDMTADDFQKIYDHSSIELQKMVDQLIEADNSLEAARLLASGDVKKKIDKYKATYSGVSYNAEDELQTVRFDIGKSNPQPTTWRVVDNKWQLVYWGDAVTYFNAQDEKEKSKLKYQEQVSKTTKKEKKRYGTFGIDDDYGFKTIGIEYVKGFDDNDYNRYSFFYEYSIKYVNTSAYAHVMQLPLKNFYTDTTIINTHQYSAFSVRLGGQCPFKYKKLYLIGIVQGELGLVFGPGVFYGACETIRVGWSTPKDNILYLSAGLHQQRIRDTSFADDDKKLSINKLNAFTLGIGFSF